MQALLTYILQKMVVLTTTVLNFRFKKVTFLSKKALQKQNLLHAHSTQNKIII